MKFTKMQGLGNDYIYVYSDGNEDWEKLSPKLSDRHFGIGADGIIVISSSEIADFKMRIFNADGSEAKMCGNGIRCVGKFLYDKKYTNNKNISIETLAGIKHITLKIENSIVTAATVDMGISTVLQQKSICFNNCKYLYFPTDIGNSHAVIFCENCQNVDVEKIGCALQKSTEFPDGVNVEFVSALCKNKLRMRVYERGSGITMACGTGACAAVSAAVYCGMCEKNVPVEVVLDGGILSVLIDSEKRVTMTGPAQTVFEGEVAV